MRRARFQGWIFLWHDVRNFVRRVVQGAAEDNIAFLASGLTFDALLAAIPFALLVLSLLGFVLNASAEAAQLDVRHYLDRFLPARLHVGGADPFADLERLVSGVVASREKLSLISLPLFVWFSTRLFGSLRAALCEVFDTVETRSWLRGKLYDATLVVVTGLLLVANTALSTVMAIVARRSQALGVLVGQWLVELVAFALLVALFVMIFKYAPARRVRSDAALLAALVCAIGLEVAKRLLAVYFTRVATPARLVSDANLGAVVLLVAWVYYMTLVFLIGGQVAQVYELRRVQAAQRATLYE